MKLRQLATATLTAALALGLAGAGPAHGSADSAAVTGRATVNGEPLRGVDVLLEPATTKKSTDVEKARTNHDGVFTFKDAPARSSASSGEWLLLVDGAKYGALNTYYGDTVRRGDAIRLSLSPGSSTTADVEMVAGAGIHGRVVDQDGQPVAAALVIASEEGMVYPRSDDTDSRGYFRFLGLGGGEVQLETWSSGQVTQFVSPTRGAIITVPDLVLPPERPEGKLKVKVTRLKSGEHLQLFNTKTREISTFEIVHLKGTLKVTNEVPPGRYRLVIAGTNTASKPFKIRAKKTTNIGTLKGPKKRTTLTGKIKQRNGKALQSGRVYIYDKYGTRIAKSVRVRDGKYTIKGLTKGRYTIQVRYPGSTDHRTTRHFKVTQHPKMKKSFKLTKTGTVTGTVTHGSKPVRGVEIAYVLLNETTCKHDSPWAKYTSEMDCVDEIITGPMTDEHGRFTFKNVPVGKHILIADDPSYGGYKTVASVISVKKNGTTWDVEVNE